MSTTFAEHDEYSLTRFSGGQHRGVCVQITPRHLDWFSGCIQLTRDQTKRLIKELQQFVDGEELKPVR